MKQNYIQVAEFNFPFPAEIFKTQLLNAGIEFQEQQIVETDSIVSIFSVDKIDLKKASKIKEKIDVENSISEVKHINKLQRKLAYAAITAIIIYVLYQTYRFVKFQLLWT